MNNFRRLKIYTNAMELSSLVYDATENFPISEKYGMISQIRRAVLSISANIAEGSSRSSTKDFKRFLEISLGSCFELEAFLENANREGYFQMKDDMRSCLVEQQKMTQGLIRKLEKEITKK